MGQALSPAGQAARKRKNKCMFNGGAPQETCDADTHQIKTEMHLVMGEAARPAKQAARNSEAVNICRPASL